MPDRIDIPENRRPKRILFILCLILMAASLWLARTEPLWGFGGAVLFAYISSFWIRKLLDPRPRLSLTSDGIEDRSNGFGLVSWGDITHATLDNAGSASFISLHVHNEDAYLKRLGALKRRGAMLSKSLGHSAVAIPLSGLEIEGAALLAMIHKRLMA